MVNKSNIYVGVTDNSWYDYLANNQPDELNFWQPGGKQVFRALQPYDLFLFKLHSPLNYIAGAHNFKKGSILNEQGLRGQRQKPLDIGICWYYTTPLVASSLLRIKTVAAFLTKSLFH